MATDEQKYRAYTFNIIGFALITPFGKIILEPNVLATELGIISPVLYFIFCFILCIVGLLSITHGYDILD